MILNRKDPEDLEETRSLSILCGLRGLRGLVICGYSPVGTGIGYLTRNAASTRIQVSGSANSEARIPMM